MKINNITSFIVVISIAVTGCNNEGSQKEQKKLALQIVDSKVKVEGGRY